MMVELLKNNILHEASNILRTQNADKRDFGLSFDELFRINSQNNNQTIDEYEIEINIGDNIKDDIDNEINTNFISKNKSENESVEDKSSVKKRESAKESIKKETPLSDKAEKIKMRSDTDKEELNVNFRFKNVELKHDIDSQAKEKIKNVLRDLKSGKIDESLAGEAILQILKSTFIKNFPQLKDKIVDIRIKNKNKNEKSFSLNIKNKNVLPENKKENMSIDPRQQNTNESGIKESLFAKQESKQVKDIDQKNKISEGNNKEFQSEIKLDINDLKTPNVISNVRDKVIEPQKVLEQNKQNLFQQIAKNTKIVLSQNQTKFSTMIRPENFGRIDFNFVMKDGKVNGRMILQNQDTANFFKANVEEIRAVFQKSNVELENIDIVLAGKSFGGLSDNNMNRGSTNSETAEFANTFSSVHSNSIEKFDENIMSFSQNYSTSERTIINLVI